MNEILIDKYKMLIKLTNANGTNNELNTHFLIHLDNLFSLQVFVNRIN